MKKYAVAYGIALQHVLQRTMILQSRQRISIGQAMGILVELGAVKS